MGVVVGWNRRKVIDGWVDSEGQFYWQIKMDMIADHFKRKEFNINITT